jgi:hypothetical protein
VDDMIKINENAGKAEGYDVFSHYRIQHCACRQTLDGMDF